jgi:hypothetical protein
MKMLALGLAIVLPSAVQASLTSNRYSIRRRALSIPAAPATPSGPMAVSRWIAPGPDQWSAPQPYHKPCSDGPFTVVPRGSVCRALVDSIAQATTSWEMWA